MNTKETVKKALSLLQNGDWEGSHHIAQSKEGDPDHDRLHALLHRIEGDEWNAKYWYKRCKLDFPKISIDEEIKMLLEHYS